MKAEYLGYENNLTMIQQLAINADNINNFLPKEAIIAFDIYRNLFN